MALTMYPENAPSLLSRCTRAQQLVLNNRDSETAILSDLDRRAPAPGEVLVALHFDLDGPRLPATITAPGPAFRRPAAEAAVAAINAHHRVLDCASYAVWIGEDVVLIDYHLIHDETYRPAVITADDDGRYALGDHHLWTVTDPHPALPPTTPARHRPLAKHAPTSAHVHEDRAQSDCEIAVAEIGDGRVTGECITHRCPAGWWFGTETELRHDFLCDRGTGLRFRVHQTDETPRSVGPTEMHYLLRAVVGEWLGIDDDRFHTMDPLAHGVLAVIVHDTATGAEHPLTADVAVDPANAGRVVICLRAARHDGEVGGFNALAWDAFPHGPHHAHVAAEDGVYLRTDIVFTEHVPAGAIWSPRDR